MKYSTYIKPRIRSSIKPRFRWSFFFNRLLRWFLVSYRYLIISFVILVSLIFIFKSSVLKFDMTKVKIQGVGANISSDNFSNFVSSKIQGKNLIDINEKGFENEIKNEFLFIKDVHVIKKIPTYLVINVIERVPEVVLLSKSSDVFKTYLISDDGFVLSELNNDTKDLFLKYKDLPKINYDGNLQVKSFVNDNLLRLYKDLYTSASKTPLKIINVTFSSDLITIVLEDTTEILLSSKKPIGNSFEIVYSVITKLTTEEKKIAKIDLRYSKVIVSYR